MFTLLPKTTKFTFNPKDNKKDQNSIKFLLLGCSVTFISHSFVKTFHYINNGACALVYNPPPHTHTAVT